MAVTRRLMQGIEPHQVWEALEDGKGYGDWVVGTRMIRDVDPQWPQPGSRLHYTVGYGPVRMEDTTRSLRVEPDHRLELEARAWPVGTAKVEITIDPYPDGTCVTIEEYPDKGIARTVHNRLFDLALKLRNVESLRRLERRAARR